MEAIRVGIVGGGIVGQALHHVYDRPDLQVTSALYDILPDRSRNSLPEVLEADVVFLCLPTPARADGKGLDVSAIEKFCEEHKGYRKLFVLKSTVPVGTTRRLSEKYELPNLVHCPEFLTERTAMDDVEMVHTLLLGYPDRRAIGPNMSTLLALFNRIHDQEIPYPKIHQFSSDVTEMVKIALNSFYAVKVSFFNEVSLLCKALEIDYGLVAGLMPSVGMINSNHMEVPGPDGKRGFGGRCLPKDLVQFINHLKENKVEPIMSLGAHVRGVVDRLIDPSPQEDRKRVERIIDKVAETLIKEGMVESRDQVVERLNQSFDLPSQEDCRTRQEDVKAAGD